MIVIVGAGLAGLVCARELRRLGREDFLLLEAESAPGGRVRSRMSPEGYVLDRGFQVLLDSYPAARRHLDLDALRPRYFDNGAMLCDGGKKWTLCDPLRHPTDLLRTAFGGALTLGDQARLVALVGELFLTPDDTLLAEGGSDRDVSTAHFLLRRGFSAAAVERFFRPFFGGVLLEERLATSASLFRYYLKKFAAGRALLPARGMGEITRQLAAGIPLASLRLDCRVARLETQPDGRRARAAVTAEGERIECERLLLATEGPAATRLLEQESAAAAADRLALGVTTVYFSSSEPLYKRPLLVLPTGRRRLVRTFTQLTNVAPEYAPAGRCLLSATVLDRRGLSDDRALAREVQAEVAAMYPAAARLLEFLEVVDVPYAQRFQPAGYLRGLPKPPLENVWLAGDQTTACSIQTAIESGERAARRIVAP